jgi:PAS domain S-box-containing protein
MTLPTSQTRVPLNGAPRTGWQDAARSVVADDVAVLTLDARGMILDCSRAAERLFGYRRSEMAWHHVSMLLPQLAKVDLLPDGQPNPELRFRCRVGHRFWAVAQDGATFASELYFTALSSEGHHRLLLIVRPSTQPAIDDRAPAAG